ncbi:hypothetical protein C8F01DRAFT_670010 [Mycena amicta]|nr:hypothetical protein C8F01DRAFT_670010 [Mycena amicta]
MDLFRLHKTPWAVAVLARSSAPVTSGTCTGTARERETRGLLRLRIESVASGVDISLDGVTKEAANSRWWYGGSRINSVTRCHSIRCGLLPPVIRSISAPPRSRGRTHLAG